MVQYPIEASRGCAQLATQRKSLISEVISSPIPGTGVLTTRDGQPFPRTDGHLFGRQHHPDQILNYLSLAGVDLAEPLVADGQRFTVQDLLATSMNDAWRERELSWTVSAYAHYLKPGRSWTNRFGEQMSLETLVRCLLDSKENACGGTHRLAALARVVSHPEFRNDAKSSRIWAETLAMLRREVAALKANQLETGFFALPPTLLSQDNISLVERNITFTGHTIEWLSLLPEPELARSEWVVRAVHSTAAQLPELFGRYGEAVAPRTAWTAIDPSSQFVVGSVSHAVGGLTRWNLRVREDLTF